MQNRIDNLFSSLILAYLENNILGHRVFLTQIANEYFKGNVDDKNLNIIKPFILLENL